MVFCLNCRSSIMHFGIKGPIAGVALGVGLSSSAIADNVKELMAADTRFAYVEAGEGDPKMMFDNAACL
jgi:hypothetical protein